MQLAAAHADGFPLSLESAPVLLPTAESAMRRALDRWFERNGVAPRSNWTIPVSGQYSWPNSSVAT